MKVCLRIPVHRGKEWRHVEVTAYTTDVPGIYAHARRQLNRQLTGWQLSSGQGLYLGGTFKTLSAATATAALIGSLRHARDVNWQHVTPDGWNRRERFDPEFVQKVGAAMVTVHLRAITAGLVRSAL